MFSVISTFAPQTLGSGSDFCILWLNKSEELLRRYNKGLRITYGEHVLIEDVPKAHALPRLVNVEVQDASRLQLIMGASLVEHEEILRSRLQQAYHAAQSAEKSHRQGCNVTRRWFTVCGPPFEALRGSTWIEWMDASVHLSTAEWRLQFNNG